jgi:hypothetical protein
MTSETGMTIPIKMGVLRSFMKKKIMIKVHKPPNNILPIRLLMDKSNNSVWS